MSNYTDEFNADPLRPQYFDRVEQILYSFIGFDGEELSLETKEELVRKYGSPRITPLNPPDIVRDGITVSMPRGKIEEKIISRPPSE